MPHNRKDFQRLGHAAYKQDEFSSFDSRLFVGSGAGSKVATGDQTKWTIEGGPGLRRDELRAAGAVRARTEESVGLRAAPARR